MKMMIRPAKITHSMLLDLAKRAREDHERKNADGTEFISRTPMVTGKGQRYFISKFLQTKDEEALAAISKEELEAITDELEEVDELEGVDELESITNS